MTVTYCTASDVGNFLGITFSSSTTPTDTVVNGWINEGEQYIENRTQHAWQTKTITKEYHDLDNWYEDGSGVPVYLKHRSIVQVVSGTDKIEVWDGSAWIDYVATKTEDRNNDYWINYQDGIVWLSIITYKKSKDMVRVTYRYGETSVPTDIRRACILLTAIKFLQNEARWNLLVEGGNQQINHAQRIDLWKQEIEDILNNYREFELATK